MRSAPTTTGLDERFGFDEKNRMRDPPFEFEHGDGEKWGHGASCTVAPTVPCYRTPNRTKSTSRSMLEAMCTEPPVLFATCRRRA